VTECADAIFGLRETKKTVSISRYSMASAAYWLGAAAQTVVAAPLSTTGSIGCWMLHIDQSKAMEAEGITATMIKAGKFKVEANPFQPLTQEARDFLQSQVDTTYGAFVGAVAKYRGVTAGAVRSGYGEGRSLMDNEAKAAGLVDSVLPAATLGARLVAGTRIALGEGLEIQAEDWCALGLGSLVTAEPLPKEAHAWEGDADYLRLLAMGAA
jgi:signal peptide peptidase SppA